MKYQIKNIKKHYNDLNVLDDISIDFEQHKTTCILGKSGTGKTTLLKIIGGMLDKDSGEIIGFQEEDSSFVFQEDRLMEWKNVKDNISFVLEGKMDKKQIDKTVDKYLKIVNLEEYKDYYPKELSIGMRQRISILRAFVYPSKLLIMDEPFKSLDINNRKIVIDLFKKLRRLEKKTCILVTHNIEEALSLGDKIIIFSDKPTKIRESIDNPFVQDQKNDEKEKLKNLIEDKLRP